MRVYTRPEVSTEALVVLLIGVPALYLICDAFYAHDSRVHTAIAIVSDHTAVLYHGML